MSPPNRIPPPSRYKRESSGGMAGSRLARESGPGRGREARSTRSGTPVADMAEGRESARRGEPHTTHSSAGGSQMNGRPGTVVMTTSRQGGAGIAIFATNASLLPPSDVSKPREIGKSEALVSPAMQAPPSGAIATARPRSEAPVVPVRPRDAAELRRVDECGQSGCQPRNERVGLTVRVRGWSGNTLHRRKPGRRGSSCHEDVAVGADGDAHPLLISRAPQPRGGQ